MTAKYCTKCKQHLPLEKFGKDKSRKDGLTFNCRDCINSYNRDYYGRSNKLKIKSKKRYQKHRRQYRNWELKRLFGMSIEDYERILQNQNNVCKICERPEISRKSKTLSVDHDHSTGKVRGLLCSNCNLGLGNFQDDVSLLNNAIAYLKESNHE